MSVDGVQAYDPFVAGVPDPFVAGLFFDSVNRPHKLYSTYVAKFEDCKKTNQPVAKHPVSSDLMKEDTIGALLENQQLWEVPGINHLRHGFNIITGEEAIAPAFEYTYCENKVAQDLYRSNVYRVPDQAEVDFYPQCSYQADTKQYSSSREMANDKEEESSFDTDVHVKKKPYFSFNGAFSDSRPVRTAEMLETGKNGFVLETTATCVRTRAAPNSMRLSKALVDDLEIVLRAGYTYNNNQANYNERDYFYQKISEFIDKFGTEYYHEAELGGKITQLAKRDEISESNLTKKAETSAMKMKFGAHLSAYGYSGDASISYAKTKSEDEENQEKFQNETQFSELIVEGGSPGAFGPSVGGKNPAPQKWCEWAASVDLLPMPVKYKLKDLLGVIVGYLQKMEDELKTLLKPPQNNPYINFTFITPTANIPDDAVYDFQPKKFIEMFTTKFKLVKSGSLTIQANKREDDDFLFVVEMEIKNTNTKIKIERPEAWVKLSNGRGSFFMPMETKFEKVCHGFHCMDFNEFTRDQDRIFDSKDLFAVAERGGNNADPAFEKGDKLRLHLSVRSLAPRPMINRPAEYKKFRLCDSIPKEVAAQTTHSILNYLPKDQNSATIVKLDVYDYAIDMNYYFTKTTSASENGANCIAFSAPNLTRAEKTHIRWGINYGMRKKGIPVMVLADLRGRDPNTHEMRVFRKTVSSKQELETGIITFADDLELEPVTASIEVCLLSGGEDSPQDSPPVEVSIFGVTTNYGSNSYTSMHPTVKIEELQEDFGFYVCYKPAIFHMAVSNQLEAD